MSPFCNSIAALTPDGRLQITLGRNAAREKGEAAESNWRYEETEIKDSEKKQTKTR